MFSRKSLGENTLRLFQLLLAAAHHGTAGAGPQSLPVLRDLLFCVLASLCPNFLLLVRLLVMLHLGPARTLRLSLITSAKTLSK